MIAVQDPEAANIRGEKRVVHTLEHSFNWGYIALSVAVIVVIWWVAKATSEEEE